MSSIAALFPVTVAASWQTQANVPLSPHLIDWLYDPSSLTARLKTHCQHFRVEVIGQHIESCHADEANANISVSEKVLVREVLLYCDESPQVFARSLLPLKSLTGEQQQLANLGTQPLGQVLFNNPNLERQSFEIARFDAASKVAQLANQLLLPCKHDLWGRRSLFIVDNKPIMVAEVFLPQAFAYQQGVTL
jgi:chorismate--pyruvate lyase